MTHTSFHDCYKEETTFRGCKHHLPPKYVMTYKCCFQNGPMASKNLNHAYFMSSKYLENKYCMLRTTTKGKDDAISVVDLQRQNQSCAFQLRSILILN